MANNTEILSQISLALSYVLQNSVDLSDEQALAVSAIYPAWHENVKYKTGQVVRYDDGNIYRCAQNHTSEAGNEPPASDDWKIVEVDPSTGYEKWIEPSNAANAYNYGDIVWYPEIGDQLYMSIKNNNKKEPTDAKSWEPIDTPATLSVDPYADWEITEEGLSAHTIAELQEYMEANGIDDSGCNVKADYIARIIENS